MLTRRVQGARRALAEAIDREERTREMDPLPMNPVVTRAAENNARTGSSGLSAPFCPLAFLLSPDQSEGWLVGAVGIELHFKSIRPMFFNALQPPFLPIGTTGTST